MSKKQAGRRRDRMFLSGVKMYLCDVYKHFLAVSVYRIVNNMSTRYLLPLN